MPCSHWKKVDILEKFVPPKHQLFHARVHRVLCPRRQNSSNSCIILQNDEITTGIGLQYPRVKTTGIFFHLICYSQFTVVWVWFYAFETFVKMSLNEDPWFNGIPYIWFVSPDLYTRSVLCFLLQATIGIDFLSKTMYLEDRTVSARIILVAGAVI
jgi:hypothetical protein